MRILIFLQAHTFTCYSPTPPPFAHSQSLPYCTFTSVHSIHSPPFTPSHTVSHIHSFPYTYSHSLPQAYSPRFLSQTHSHLFTHSLIFPEFLPFWRVFRENPRGVGVWHLCCCWLHFVAGLTAVVCVPAVDCVPAVASIPAVASVPLVPAVLTVAGLLLLLTSLVLLASLPLL